VTGGSPSVPVESAVSAPVPTPTASVVGLAEGRAPWDSPLRLAVADATLTAVSVTDPDGAGVPGTLTPAGWTSESTLVPAATYTASLTVRDAVDRVQVLPLTAQTTAATSIVKAALSPGDDSVVGVGKAVQVTLDQDVTDPAARDAVVSRLVVSASPAVPGAWRWMDARTIHYRPAAFWQPGTKVTVHFDLQRLSLPGGTWGSGVRTTHFTVGDAVISTVDVAAHTMTVRRGGTVLRVMKASMGKPQFATRNGTFLVLEKFRKRIMDSATVNLPPGTPAYKTAVEHAVRITNSGTFTHGAPWSLKSQGVANVSHGCINLSPADAAFFFDLSRRGDVVKVVNSTREANSFDAGSRDWNMSFADWQA
jgi:lipoprotein-anchoring transpeptidase ErfK/SrfK